MADGLIKGMKPHEYWNQLRRNSKPLKRGAPIKRSEVKLKRTRVKKVSKAQASILRLYGIARKQWLLVHDVCEACCTEGCTKEHPMPSTDVHHKRGKATKLLWLAIAYWLAVCRQCHDWIERHPEEAKKLGLSENRLN